MHPEGEQLRRLREKTGHTLARVSSLSGVNPTMLSRIENGHAGIGPRSAVRLRKVLGPAIEGIVTADVAELLGWGNSPLAS